MYDDISVGIQFALKNLDQVEGKIDSLNAKLENIKSVVIDFTQIKQDLQQTVESAKKITQGLQSASDVSVVLKDNLSKLGEVKTLPSILKQTETHTANVSKGFKHITGTIGKMVGALLTVRGVWFGIRKAVTTYLSQNEELQTKMNSLYYGLGSLFAPVVEWLVNLLGTAISYVNVLVKALGFAGINMKNFNKSATSSAKAAKNMLASFDEINNLTSSSSGGGTSSLTDAFDFDETKLNSGIVKALKKIGELLKPIKEAISGFIEANWTISSKLLNGDPLTEDELKTRLLTDIGLASVGVGLLAFSPTFGGKVLGATLTLAGLLDGIWTVKSTLENPEVSEGLKNRLKKALLVGLGLSGLAFAALSGNGILLCLSLKGIIEIAWDILNNTDGDISTTRTTSSGAVAGGGGSHKFVTTTATTGTSNPNRKGGLIASYDVGTNYVPNDQLAFVHKGEAIVPSEFNPSAFNNQSTVEELNLLVQINSQLEQLNRKNIDIQLDGTSVANKISEKIEQINYRNGAKVFAIER